MVVSAAPRAAVRRRESAIGVSVGTGTGVGVGTGTEVGKSVDHTCALALSSAAAELGIQLYNVMELTDVVHAFVVTEAELSLFCSAA